MSITDAQYLTWLRSTAERTVLVEAQTYSGGVVVTRYMSNRPWISAPTDLPANQTYDDVVLDMPGIRANMAETQRGRSLVSFGDIEIDNAGGERDGWLLDAWDGRQLRIYVGDSAWPRADFRLVFSGVSADIQAHGDDALTLRVRDRQLVLDTPMLTATVGGSGSTATQVLPRCYGQVYNVEPVLVDAATRKYQVHAGQIEALDVVRVAGDVLNAANYTVDLATGTFTTAYAISGQLTCDVRGSKTGGVYVNTAAAIFQRVLTECAGLTVADDVDSAALATFASDAPGVVGLYVRDESTTILDALDTLITGVGGYYSVKRDGRFTAGQFKAASGTPVLTLTADDIDAQGIELTRRIVPYTAIRLGYARNYTPSSSISANVAAADTRAKLATEYQIATAATSASAAYLLATQSDLIPSAYATLSNANTEAARLAGLYGVLRRVFTLRATLCAQQINLGDVVGLDLPRYSLAGGVLAKVVGLREAVISDVIELEVWI